MWVVRSSFFTGLLYIYLPADFDRSAYYQFLTTVLIRFQLLSLAFKSCCILPTVASEDACWRIRNVKSLIFFFLQYALFCHVCNGSSYISSVKNLVFKNLLVYSFSASNLKEALFFFLKKIITASQFCAYVTFQIIVISAWISLTIVILHKC